jgi:predicted O-methyltransferase YrrM
VNQSDLWTGQIDEVLKYTGSALSGTARGAFRLLATAVADPRQASRAAGGLIKRVASYGEGPEHAANLPSRHLPDILPGIGSTEVRLRHTVEYRSLPYAEAFVLASVVSHLKPGKIFEIGTSIGAGTAIMAGSAPPSAHVYTLDLPPDHRDLALPGLDDDPPESDPEAIGRRFRGTAIAKRISQLYGDSATFDYSPYRGTMDFVFVDGSHSYEYVTGDSQAALEMLSPRGVIVWDDCSREFPGLVRALDELGASMAISRIAFTRFAMHVRSSAPGQD